MVKGLSTGREKLDSMANTSRMTSYQRRRTAYRNRSIAVRGQGIRSSERGRDRLDRKSVETHRLRTFRRKGRPVRRGGGPRNARAHRRSHQRAVRPAGASAPNRGTHRACAAHLRGGKRRRLPRAHARFAENRPVQLVQFAAWRHCRTRRGHSHRRVPNASICRPKACRITRRCSSA